MNKYEQLINAGESLRVEFKQTFSKEALESITAFANTNGGYLFVGVNDKGLILGIDVNNEIIKNWQNQIKLLTTPSLFPDIKIMTIQNKTIAVVLVQEHPLKPVSIKGRYIKRLGSSNHLISTDEIVMFQLSSFNISYDSIVSKSENQLNYESVNRFITLIKQSGRYKVEGNYDVTLNKLGILRNGKLTFAGEALFNNPGVAIHIGRFKTKDIIIDDILIKKSLIDSIEDAISFIKKNISVAFEFDDEKTRRNDKWQYPLLVLRELLLNAIIHRDYSNPTDIIIKIFDNCIEFISPGGLFGSISLNDLNSDNYLASHRNKILAEAFYLIGEVEKYGTGIIRARRILKENYPNLILDFKEKQSFFVASLSQVFLTTQKTTQKTTQEMIVELLTQNTHMTGNELAEHIGISRDAIKQHIGTLKRKGILKRVGGRKLGRWLVIEKQL